MVSTDTTEVILSHKLGDVAVTGTSNRQHKCCCAIICEEDKITKGAIRNIHVFEEFQ